MSLSLVDVSQCEPLIGGCRSAGLSLGDVGQCEALVGGCRSV